MDLVLVRLLFIIVVSVASYFIEPFRLSRPQDAAVGALVGAGIVLFEWKLRTVSLKRLIGAAIGSLLGICGAYLFALVIRSSVPAGNTQSFLQILVMLLMAYVGLIVGASKGDLLNLAALGGIFGGEKQGKKSYKILDTSVIIDGRIADIAETGFLDGIIVTPQFVLRELQLVADSADSLKRNRGRRGLDVLQRLQKMATLQIQIVEDDFPAVREVDLKLIELAKVYEGKIITNDFNLNKVAQLQGVEVLNINELANSLKPIVLPGEIMKVFILKEGKEYNQGVAYFDDGTMVVVDNARKMIGKTIDVSVTSVLQTTAGKMIFGKWDERAFTRTGAPAQPAVPVIPGAPGPAAAVPNTLVESKPDSALGRVDRCHRNGFAVESSDDLDALSGCPLEGRCFAFEIIGFVPIHQSEGLATANASPCAVGGSHAHGGRMFCTAVTVCNDALIGLRCGCGCVWRLPGFTLHAGCACGRSKGRKAERKDARDDAYQRQHFDPETKFNHFHG